MVCDLQVEGAAADAQADVRQAAADGKAGVRVCAEKNSEDKVRNTKREFEPIIKVVGSGNLRQRRRRRERYTQQQQTWRKRRQPVSLTPLPRLGNNKYAAIMPCPLSSVALARPQYEPTGNPTEYDRPTELGLVLG